jgi:lipopolysaccharide assembly protein A
MQFLKLLFWCLMAFLAAVFTFGNWTNVSIQLFGGLVAEVNLPLLLLTTFLLGFVPTLVYQHWMRYRLRQRLTAAERSLETERALAAARTGEPVAPGTIVPVTPPPPAAIPTAVPPGVA